MLLCGCVVMMPWEDHSSSNIICWTVADAIMLKWPMAKCPLVESFIEQPQPAVGALECNRRLSSAQLG